MRRRSELSTYRFGDICQVLNKTSHRTQLLKDRQIRDWKDTTHQPRIVLLIKKWRSINRDKGYILRPINRHGHFGSNLHPASISITLKAMQRILRMDSDEQAISGHSLRVGAALDLIEQGEPLERIMIRRIWQPDATARAYLRNWTVYIL